MDGEQQVRCPLCDGTYEVGAAYAAHLRDVHDLVDDEVPAAESGAGAGGAGLDLGILAAAAASLAQPDEPLPVPAALALAPAPPAPRRRDRRRAAAILLAVAVVATGWSLVGAGDGGSWIVGAGGADPEIADGSFGPGDGLVEVAGTSVVPPPTSAPGTAGASGASGASATTVPGASPPSTATAGPGTEPPTTRPGRPPSTGPSGPSTPSTPVTTRPSPPPPPPPPPPPTTTTPATTVRATQATVLRCTKAAGTRTLVFGYVLSGSASDGRHEATISARVSDGPITVSTVQATEPDGTTVVVRLEPAPVVCA